MIHIRTGPQSLEKEIKQTENSILYLRKQLEITDQNFT